MVVAIITVFVMLSLVAGVNATSNLTATEGSPVEKHGNLTVKGNQTLDQNGMPVRFQGMSFFWSMWMSKYWNEDVINWLKNDWKVSIVRLAMGVEHQKGYLDQPEKQKKLLENAVKAAIQAGLYVIIDWHDHHAHLHVNESVEFFDEMAKTYGQYPNVLFETFNEPMDQDWPVVKTYHQKIVDVIRNQTDNIIILGTTTYSQDVDIASDDPVNGTNLLYTLHFYAASHKGQLRDKARKALSSGIALMVTEWGTCDYTGNGTLDFDSTRKWMEFLDENHISDCNWAISDKYESCSALMPGASPTGNWVTKVGVDLTYSGALVRHLIRGTDTGGSCSASGWPCVPPKCAGQSNGCKREECCQVDSETCFEKDAGWAQCMTSCAPGIHTTDAKEYQTPWSCQAMGQPMPGPPWTIIFRGRRYVALDTVLIAFAILLVCFCVIAVLLCKRRGQSSPEYQSMS